MEVTALGALQKLEYLNVSFNSIENLTGFIELHGKASCLIHLDIRGNKIKDSKELQYLKGCNVSALVNCRA